MSCWAAAIAMIVSWAKGVRITPLEVAAYSDRLLQYKTGLEPLDAGLFEKWGMVTEAPQTFTSRGFVDLLRDCGPIWVAAQVFAPHIRVVTGFEYDADPNAGIVHINDPLERGMTFFRASNRGATYTETYVEFVAQNEALGFRELSIDDKRHYPVYFAHLREKPEHR
jgi:hypothetical protein